MCSNLAPTTRLGMVSRRVTAAVSACLVRCAVSMNRSTPSRRASFAIVHLLFFPLTACARSTAGWLCSTKYMYASLPAAHRHNHARLRPQHPWLTAALLCKTLTLRSSMLGRCRLWSVCGPSPESAVLLHLQTSRCPGCRQHGTAAWNSSIRQKAQDGH